MGATDESLMIYGNIERGWNAAAAAERLPGAGRRRSREDIYALWYYACQGSRVTQDPPAHALQGSREAGCRSRRRKRDGVRGEVVDWRLMAFPLRFFS